MSQVGMRIKRHRRKEDDDRLSQRVGGFNRNVERWIIERASGTLHPVHDATERVGAPGRRTVTRGSATSASRVRMWSGSRARWRCERLHSRAVGAAAFKSDATRERMTRYQRPSAIIAANTSSATSASTAGRTSCTRTMGALPRMLATMAAQRAVKPLVRRSIL